MRGGGATWWGVDAAPAEAACFQDCSLDMDYTDAVPHVRYACLEPASAQLETFCNAMTAAGSPAQGHTLCVCVLCGVTCAGCDLEPASAENRHRHHLSGCCDRPDHHHQPTGDTCHDLRCQRLRAGWAFINCVLRDTDAFPGVQDGAPACSSSSGMTSSSRYSSCSSCSHSRHPECIHAVPHHADCGGPPTTSGCSTMQLGFG